MFKVYILRSDSLKRNYIGHTSDLDKRLKRHNTGLVRSTKGGVPWSVIYTEDYQTKSEAYKRELEIKSYKGGIQLKKLIGQKI